jgi:hypothetical protein
VAGRRVTQRWDESLEGQSLRCQDCELVYVHAGRLGAKTKGKLESLQTRGGGVGMGRRAGEGEGEEEEEEEEEE